MWPFSSSYPDCSASDVYHHKRRNFDYVIVGGGTAGCCLAARLSEDPSVSVLLIERGEVADGWSSRVPLVSANFYRGGAPAKLLQTEPCAGLDNRSEQAVLGNGLGGGSRINGCVYTRAPQDFDQWERMGHSGWGYKTMEPYFMKSEQSLSHVTSEHRGKKGPWTNQIFPNSDFKIVSKTLEAAERLGFKFFSDVNDPNVPLSYCGYVDLTIDENTHRVSTFEAFLPASVAKARKNLVICTSTVVTNLGFWPSHDHCKPKIKTITFEKSASSKGSGSEGRAYFVNVNKEVILCAGGISSPHILMLSGIGPKSHLADMSIHVVKDLPGVGSFLKDHAALGINYEVPMHDSLHSLRNQPLRVISELLKYLSTGKGLFAVPFMVHTICTHTSLLDSESRLTSPQTQELPPLPDTEIMAIPHRCQPLGEISPLNKYGVFALLLALWRPKSHGTVRLSSNDPLEDPLVNLDLLSNPEDITTLRKQVRLARRLAKEIKEQGYPLADLEVPEDDTDEKIDAYARKNLRTSYHYTSTCRMSPENDPLSPGVVDNELRVWGVEGVRVCDCSVFPDMISGHPMAPVVAIAERCADLIKAQRPKTNGA
jgi:choline dehydrogenase-like flavoprotein